MSYGQFSRFAKGKRTLADLTASALRDHAGRYRPGHAFDFERVANNTLRFRGNAATVYRLQDTDIVTRHDDGRVTLNSDGWQTLTTKERMNRYLPCGWWVYSDRGWLIRTPKGVFPFADGATFDQDGTPTASTARQMEREAKRVASDKRLISAWLKKLRAEGWSEPAGDPWIAPNERGLFPEATVREWLKEGYVTRLVVRQALAWAGYRDPDLILYLRGIDGFTMSPVRRFLKACLRVGA